jgi:uncharacterized membrane protein
MSRKDIKYILLLIATTLISYFEIAFFMFSTKWDNLSAFFAYKYTASKWWTSGHIPLWDPYQNLGYPMHANPQGGVWYPITWLFSLPSGYSVYSLNMEVVFHFVTAAIGMYFFTKHLKVKRPVAFLAALAYSLSGFIFGTSNMLGFTAGVAWLPWVLLFLHKTLNKASLKNIITFSVLMYLQITGAYTAFTIILAYVLLGYTFMHLIKVGFSKSSILGLLKFSLISLVVVGLLSAPYIYSIADSLPYFSRANPLDYDVKQFGGNFSLQCFLSLAVPYVVSSAEGFTGVDVSLSNIFIGLPFLVFFILYVLRFKHREKLIYLGVIALFFLLGLGINTPVHEFFHQYIPGFNMFRHPYLYTLYALFLMILLGSFYLNKSISNNKLKDIRLAFLSLSIVFTVCMILLVSKIDFTAWDQYVNQVKVLSENSPLSNYTHGFMQLGLGLVFIVALLIGLKNKQRFVRILPFVLFLDLFVALQLNSPKNLYYNAKFSWLTDYLEQEANSDLTNQLAETSLESLQNKNIKASVGFWVNLNTYQRTTGIDGYNPFIFKDYIELQESKYFNKFIKKGIAYTSNNYTHFEELGYNNLSYGTAIDSGNIKQFRLGYNSINLEVKVDTPSRVFINQNYHHNWRAFVNNKQVDIEKSNIALMSIPLNEGNSKVTFKYEVKHLKLLHYVSLIALAISTLLIVILRRKAV